MTTSASLWGKGPVTQDMVLAVTWAPSTLPDKRDTPSPTSAQGSHTQWGPGTTEVPQSWRTKCQLLLGPHKAPPTYQLDALGERVVLPVLLWEALQDLALAFPTP